MTLSANGTHTMAAGGVPSVAVVGGGWSGIAATWYLRRRGVPTVLLEAGAQLGGRSASGTLAGRRVTYGGKNIGRTYSHFREFARAMGDPSYEEFGISSSRIENDRPRSIDSSRRWRSTLDLLRGLPPGDVARIVRAGVRVKRDPDARYVGDGWFADLAARRGDPPVDAWLGRRAAERLARPMTVRMNGAEPDEVHLGTFGSNLGGVLDSYDQLVDGFDGVLAHFVAGGPCELGTHVDELIVDSGEVVGLRVRTADGSSEVRRCSGVVVALPAYAAAPLVEPHLRRVAFDLRAIRYFPAAVVLAKYRRPVFPRETRALLMPVDSPASNAGAYGIDDRDLVRYTFSGRAARDPLARGTAAEALLADAEGRLGRFFPVSSADREDFVSRRWTHALCAYSRGHADRVARIQALAGGVRGLYLTGDYVRGGTIEGCFRAGRERAADVAHALVEQVAA